MNFRSALDRTLFLLSVPKCVCCKGRLNYGELSLCPKCSAEFEEIKTRNCSRCSRILSECFCSTEFLSSHFVKGVVKCFRYDPREENLAANGLIYSLKRDNRDDVLKRCTAELCRAIENSLSPDNSFVVTNVPRRKGAIVKYGIDHSELLAKGVAVYFGIKYMKLLKSNAKSEQKTLTKDERLHNTDFQLVSDDSLKGKSVIIIDDIITTGASVASSATMIKSLRPKNIYSAVLGIAYRDDQ